MSDEREIIDEALRISEAQFGMKYPAAEAAVARLESQNQALQEALDEIRDRSTCPNHPTCPHGCESIANAALAALSPTQETDLG